MSKQSQATYEAAAAIIESQQWGDDDEAPHVQLSIDGLIDKLTALFASDNERFELESFAEACTTISKGYTRWRRNRGGGKQEVPSPAGDTEYRWDR
jgi:hypothetical protein